VHELAIEGGANNPPRAYRWSSWWWLSTPSQGLLLGVKVEGDPQWHVGVTLFRGGLSSWFLRGYGLG